MLTVKLQKPNNRIAQIYACGIEYAFVTHEPPLEQVTPFVFSKDHLLVAVYATLWGEAKNIYGFRYDPATDPPLPLSRTRLLLKNDDDPTFGDKVSSCLEFMRQVSEALGIRPTTAEPCDGGKVYLFTGPRQWLHAPPMFSLYTMMLRCGFVHPIGGNYRDTLDGIMRRTITPYQKHDAMYMPDVLAALDCLLRLGWRSCFHRVVKKNYPKIAADSSHLDRSDVCVLLHYSGIVSYAQGQAVKYGFAKTGPTCTPKNC